MAYRSGLATLVLASAVGCGLRTLDPGGTPSSTFDGEAGMDDASDGASDRGSESTSDGDDSVGSNGGYDATFDSNPEDGSDDGYDATSDGSHGNGSDSSSDATSDSSPGSGSEGGEDAASDGSNGHGSDSSSDAMSDSGSDAAGCTPGAQQCAGGESVQTCGADGQWGTPWVCASGVCTDGACEGLTTPGTSCDEGSGDGVSNCGATSESCCTSLDVPGGTYYRTYQNSGSGPTGEADPATVSGFRLDKYDVTVGRFRRFVSAVLPADGGVGWTPPAGSGIHTHLNGGRGLVNVANPGTYETGWVTSDNSAIAPTDANLKSQGGTWTPSPLLGSGSQERLPMTGENWYEAYAFCIWDGGFLPSEAEWEYAAAGGSQEREYPWGSTDPGGGNRFAIYGDNQGNCYYPIGALAACDNTGVTNIAPVGTPTLGAGLWGQLDLAGEVWEWTMDGAPLSGRSYVNPCDDCAYLMEAGPQRIRGGDFSTPPNPWLTSEFRGPGNPTYPHSRGRADGFRCARSP